MKVHDKEYVAWGLALKEAQGGGLPCGSIKAGAEGGLETAKRFQAPDRVRAPRRGADMEQGNPPSCAGNSKVRSAVMCEEPFFAPAGRKAGATP